MKLDDQKVLFVLPKFNEVAAKSLRNIAWVRYTTSAQLNPYELMTHKNALFVWNAYDVLEERLK
jgi:ribosomal protein L4